MKTGNCNHCPINKNNRCRKICWIVTADLNRIENGRKKNKVTLVPMADMEWIEYAAIDNLCYATYDGD